MSKWQFWVDRGGTFTDLIARTPDGRIKTAKLLSDNPHHYADAVLQGIRELMSAPPGTPLPSHHIDCVRMGTTVATNALLERKGARTLLVTTRGYADVLKIGYQNRPDIFALDIRLPEPLYEQVLEVDERLAADGSVITPLRASGYRAALAQARAEGLEAVAVVFMHAYCNPAHEQALGEVAREVGFDQVTLSHETSALIKFVGRGDTAVVDAYVSPVLRRYTRRLQTELPHTRLLFMQSNGGLIEADRFQGCNSLLSGPAGGVVGGVKSSLPEGFERILGFDMGGTSTDVWHFGGQDYERVYETMLAGIRLRVPMLDIHTVAAGGGSVCRFAGGRFRVGPESAGANPGPACYGRGGPLTVTDCNLVLGKLALEYFPQVFGASGAEALNVDLARQKLMDIAAAVEDATGEAASLEALAEGFIDVAIEGMAAAIKKVSTERGHDVGDYVLCSFGGAAGQHACRVAQRLGVATVLVHPLAGVLSALGMGVAEVATQVERSLEWQLGDPGLADDLAEVIDQLSQQARAQLSDTQDARDIQWKTQVFLRYQGSNTAIGVRLAEAGEMRRAFEQAHLEQFAFLQAGRALVVDSVSLEALITGAVAAEEVARAPDPASAFKDCQHSDRHHTSRLYSGRKWWSAPLYQRQQLSRTQQIIGPAVIVDASATTVVEPGWQAQVLDSGSLQLTRVSAGSGELVEGEKVAGRSLSGRLHNRDVSIPRSPVQLEVFNYRFMSIAEQMGVVLANTAHSVNIKERFDFSCALFDAQGKLVANAPHVPVHLGSMGETVEQVMAKKLGDFKPGDAYLVNSPYAGGTHLPDLTVVTPVFVPGHIVSGNVVSGNVEVSAEVGAEARVQVDASPAFFVATRAHHADVGGVTPGSIPPGSTCIEEEGVLFEGFSLIDNGVFRGEALREHLQAGPWPARNVEQNLADLQAQIGANVTGAKGLQKLVADYGLAVVEAYMGYVQDNADEAVRRVISQLKDGESESVMDSGARVRVAVRVDRARQRLTVDFRGTSTQQASNFNAPAAVCRAAVLYVLRTLVADDIPLNAGCLRSVEILIPEASMLNPEPPAAVVAGNVETSQYVVDVLFAALGVLAGSQGTMNNLTFGNDRFQYYETICGGAGAGEGFHGASAVQVHMTNSRMTDPEILEQRYPVRLEQFRVRTGSGGAGAFRGGDGVIRSLRFLESMSVALVSSHRDLPPAGVNGGGAGKTGVNFIGTVDGQKRRLAGVAEARVEPGDTLTIETPGGGGYGLSASDTEII